MPLLPFDSQFPPPERGTISIDARTRNEFPIPSPIARDSAFFNPFRAPARAAPRRGAFVPRLPCLPRWPGKMCARRISGDLCPGFCQGRLLICLAQGDCLPDRLSPSQTVSLTHLCPGFPVPLRQADHVPRGKLFPSNNTNSHRNYVLVVVITV